jgi:iron complex transport system substrate-binding protein
MKKISFSTICAIIALLVLSTTCTAGKTIKVTDMVGRHVTAPFDPDRIVCIGPGALRLIVYLKAQSKVIGVEDMEKKNPDGRPYWIAYPELSKLPRCGPGGPAGINKKPDLEALLALKPQVIFITYMEAPLADEVQKTIGIPVVVLSYGAFATFDEAVYDAMRIAGKVLKREKRADDIVAYIESLRKDMRRRTKDIPVDSKPTAYVGGIGYRGTQGIESTEQKYIPFKWIGVNNIAEQVKADHGSHVFMDKEALLKLNPEVIFIDGGGTILVADDFRKKSEFYHTLKAFTNQRVYTLHPFNWYTTNIGTALADAYAIGKILHAKAFEDIDPHQKADEIYTFLVGKPVYKKMQEEYGPIGQKAQFID